MIFFIDHWLDRVIKNDVDFQHHDTIKVTMENRQKGNEPLQESQEIEIYENSSPNDFFNRQSL